MPGTVALEGLLVPPASHAAVLIIVTAGAQLTNTFAHGCGSPAWSSLHTVPAQVSSAAAFFLLCIQVSLSFLFFCCCFSFTTNKTELCLLAKKWILGLSFSLPSPL